MRKKDRVKKIHQDVQGLLLPMLVDAWVIQAKAPAIHFSISNGQLKKSKSHTSRNGTSPEYSPICDYFQFSARKTQGNFTSSISSASKSCSTPTLKFSFNRSVNPVTLECHWKSLQITAQQPQMLTTEQSGATECHCCLKLKPAVKCGMIIQMLLNKINHKL